MVSHCAEINYLQSAYRSFEYECTRFQANESLITNMVTSKQLQ